MCVEYESDNYYSDDEFIEEYSDDENLILINMINKIKKQLEDNNKYFKKTRSKNIKNRLVNENKLLEEKLYKLQNKM
jgi:hypothetical protein